MKKNKQNSKNRGFPPMKTDKNPSENIKTTTRRRENIIVY